MQTNERLEIKPGEVRCPRCLAKDLVPSRPRGAGDAIMRRFGRVPRHCRACGHRFYTAVIIAKPSRQRTGAVISHP